MALLHTVILASFLAHVQCSPDCVDSSNEQIPCSFLLATESGTGSSGDEGQGYFDGVYAYIADEDFFQLTQTYWNTSKSAFLYHRDDKWVLDTNVPAQGDSLDYSSIYGYADYTNDNRCPQDIPGYAWSGKNVQGINFYCRSASPPPLPSSPPPSPPPEFFVTTSRYVSACPRGWNSEARSITGQWCRRTCDCDWRSGICTYCCQRDGWSCRRQEKIASPSPPSPPPPSPPAPKPPPPRPPPPSPPPSPPSPPSPPPSTPSPRPPPPCPPPPPSPPSPPPPPSPSPPPPKPEKYAWLQSCDYTCRNKKNNGQCDGECNNPDCGFDGGDCCKGSGGKPNGKNYPLVCQDPKYSMTDDGLESYRLDYHVPRCRKQPRNQYGCGCCYAFAAITTVNLQMCKAGNSKHKDLLSASFVESCTEGRQGGPGRPQVENCIGGSAGNTLRNLQKEGLGTEACYPYHYTGYRDYTGERNFVGCSTVYGNRDTKKCNKADYNVFSSDQVKFANVRFDGSDEAFEKIKVLIQEVGALVTGYRIYEDFYDWKFEYGPHMYPLGRNHESYISSGRIGGHSMTLIGYGEYKDTTRNNKRHRYFVIQNSWGLYQGHDKGHIYLDADNDNYANGLYGDVTIHGTQLLKAYSTAKNDRSRKLLWEMLQEVDSEPIVSNNETDTLRETGTILATNCSRSHMDGAMEAAIAVMEKFAKEQGHDAKVEEFSRDTCNAQVTSYDHMMVEATMLVNGMKQKYSIDASRVVPQECNEFLEFDNGTLQCVDHSDEFELLNLTADSVSALVGKYVISVIEENGNSAGGGTVPYVKKDETVNIYTNQTVLHDASSSSAENEDDDAASSLSFLEVYGALLLAILTSMVFMLCAQVIMRKHASPQYSVLQEAREKGISTSSPVANPILFPNARTSGLAMQEVTGAV